MVVYFYFRKTRSMKAIRYITIAIVLGFVSFVNPVKAVAKVQEDTLTKRVYYGSGRIRMIIPYGGGKINGMEKEFYENGQLKSETPYEENVKNGVAHEYYENGEMKSETIYMDGTMGERTMFKQRYR